MSDKPLPTAEPEYITEMRGWKVPPLYVAATLKYIDALRAELESLRSEQAAAKSAPGSAE